MHRLEHPADGGAQDPIQGGLEDLHDRYVVAEHPERGRHLGADEAHPDADDPGALTDGFLDAIGIVGVTKIEHAGQPGARRIQAPVAAPGGHQQPVEGDALAAGQDHLAFAHVDLDGARAEPGVDLLLGVPLGRPDEGVVERLLAAQVLLRQGWTFVGRQRFGADQGDPSVEPFAAQRGRRGGPGQRGSDDDERPVGAHAPYASTFSCPPSSATP